jgi:hypothetical protein
MARVPDPRTSTKRHSARARAARKAQWVRRNVSDSALGLDFPPKLDDFRKVMQGNPE